MSKEGHGKVVRGQFVRPERVIGGVPVARSEALLQKDRDFLAVHKNVVVAALQKADALNEFFSKNQDLQPDKKTIKNARVGFSIQTLGALCAMFVGTTEADWGFASALMLGLASELRARVLLLDPDLLKGT
jgi:hypothetical protein